MLFPFFDCHDNSDFFNNPFNLAFEMCLLDDMEQDKSDWPPLLDDDSADDDEF